MLSPALTHAIIPACLIASLALASPAAAWQEESTRPRKVVNLKLGAGFVGANECRDATICPDSHRGAAQFGLQTGFFPWTAELSFLTTVAFDLYAGFFWPTAQIGPGWLTFHSGPFWRLEMLRKRTDAAKSCQEGTRMDMGDNVGAGLTGEYLLYEGNLGFYLELRQTFLEQRHTSVTAGITVSPLLWLYFRNN